MVIKWIEDWVEVLAFFFLVLGFLISLFLRNASLIYATMILAGFLTARVYYQQRCSQPIFPTILIVTGFLLGYLIGNIWTSRLLTLLFFIVSFACSYYLHYNKTLVIFKSENFFK